MSEELEYYIDKLFLHYNVQTIIDLAKAMGVSQSTISKWRERKRISALKKRCMKLGIYKDIFGTPILKEKPKTSTSSKPKSLSLQVQLILEKYEKAQEDGVEDQFLIHVLNF